MKKLVLASAMALASVCLVSAPTLCAQGADQGTIQISNPAEFNAYQQATSQTDPNAKATALEEFLKNYPQSVVKKSVLDDLMDAYQQAGKIDEELSAASRLLQVDPNYMKAIYISVALKKSQCLKTSEAQVCDDAAALAHKGLALPKPQATSDSDWKKLTDATFPTFHSAIALDYATAKKDYKAAIQEYKTELMMYAPQDTTKGQGLVDTLQLAETYAKPGDSRDEVQAVWFYARAWNFAPPAYKAQIQPKLEYWYKRYHGGLDGLDAVKTAAATSLFKPDSVEVKAAPTPPEIVHNVLAATADLRTLNLEDKEFILANGSKDDAQKLWTVLQNQPTPVPGIVMETSANVLKITATPTVATAKPKDYIVKMATPVACAAAPAAPGATASVKAVQDYITANADKSDLASISEIMDESAKVKKLEVAPAVGTIKVAVTQDAKDNKAPDFIVNLKEPMSCKEAPAVGFTYALQPADELDATYDTYTPVAATATRAATAQIVLRDGFVQSEKKAAPKRPAAKPAPGRRPAAHK
jgi:tetratricopeptide (TPR) repeat protein